MNEKIGLVDSEDLREFRFNNQSARAFYRFRKNFYFGSLAYEWESGADIFACVDASTMAIGKILFFSMSWMVNFVCFVNKNLFQNVNLFNKQKVGILVLNTSLKTRKAQFTLQ